MSLEDSLIKLAVTGDREAQRLIYESLKGSVSRLVARIVGASDVDDVTQDAFLHVFSALSSFRFESQFTTWVYRLVVNDALQHLRRKRSRNMVPLKDLEVPGPAPSPDVNTRTFKAGSGTKGHSSFEGRAGRRLRNNCGNPQNSRRDRWIAAQSGSARIEERIAGTWLGKLT